MSRPLLPDRFSALDDPRQRSKVVSTPPGTMLSVLCAMPAGSIAPAQRCICRTPVPPPGGCRPSAPRGAGTMVKPSRADGGNAESFRLAPGGAKALPPIQWQGPSPLPQHHADPTPTGGQGPRPAPAPPPAGAGLRSSRTCRSAGHRCARAGETRVAFHAPAQRVSPFARIGQSLPAGRRSEWCFGTLLHPRDPGDLRRPGRKRERDRRPDRHAARLLRGARSGPCRGFCHP